MNKSAEVEDVVRMAGLRYESKALLDSGSSSEVWMAQTSIGAVVVRFLASKNGIAPRIDFETTVRRRLHDDGVRVAKPIASSHEFTSVSHPRAWIVDEYICGHTYPRGKLPDSVCADLARVLIRVHDIEGRGFGLPLDRSELRGTADSVEAGLETRFDNPWPLGSLTIDQHPISEADDAIVDRMKCLEAELRLGLRVSASRLVHSDLHERQMICNRARLAGLIDFGDAMFADPAWDFASLHYFHGERALDSILSAYEPNGTTRKLLAERARLFSLCIACHHAMRSQRLDKPHRMKAAIAHLNKMLL